MFWTAFVWGLGVSLGGSIGLLAFVLMFAAFKAASETETMKKIDRHSQLVLAALVKRNDLTEETNAQLESLVEIFAYVVSDSDIDFSRSVADPAERTVENDDEPE